MNDAALRLDRLVTVDASFKPAVALPDHFNDPEQNAQLVNSYIPTSQTIEFFAEVAQSMRASSDERARMLHGTFGTGKSDLLLMLCNYVSRSVDDPLMQPFYAKLKRLHEAQYTTIYQQRANKKPFLVVLLQANAVTPFAGFILHGLEQALKQAGLDDLMLPTRYSAARQKIEAWQDEGHAVLPRFIEALRNNEAMELSRLLQELAGPSAGTVFPAFQRAFREATGTAFDIYSYAHPHETYRRVAQALCERGSHSGIVVVCDEFTEVLRRLARAGDQQSVEVEVEALGVQDLANASVASGVNQLHFVVATLVGFAGVTREESTSGSVKQTIEKAGGRFKAFALDTQDSAELLRGALLRLDKDAVALPNRQRDELIDLARTLWPNKPKTWLSEMVVEGCFPLHPIVTFALPQINNRVAQTNRTMFLFLKDQEGLSGFLAQTTLASSYPDWHNLLTLDWLFDYFFQSIQVRRQEVIDAYNHALQQLANVQFDTTLARRALKVIAFCEVVAPSLSPTRHLLRQALNLPPGAEQALRDALQVLEQIEAVYPPNDADGAALGAYSLPMPGRVNPMNLRQRVINKAQSMPEVSVSFLQAAHPAERIRAEEYNRERGSARELRAKYISLVELNSAARLKDDLNNARDGLLWYVIVSSEEKRTEAQSKARELTRRNPRLVVAVPTVPLDVLERFKSYRALQAVQGDESLDSAAKSFLQEHGKVGSGFAKPFHEAVAQLREEKLWEWFYNGASQPNMNLRADAQKLASRVMDAVYPATPKHSLEQHLKAESYTPNLGRAVAEILKPEIRISKKGNKEEVVIRKAFTELGLVKALRSDSVHEIFELTEPSSAHFNSQKVWELYKSHLRDGKPWSKLVDLLRAPPFGLYNSLIFAFSGAFFTFYVDALELSKLKGNQAQDVALDEKVLKELIEKPHDYQVRFQPLSELERRWLYELVRVGLQQPFDPSGGHGKTLRSRVAEQLKQWLKGLRLPLLAEKLQAERLAALMPDYPAPVIAAAILLLHNLRNEDALAYTLLKSLPETLGAPADHAAWDDALVADLLDAWAETCRLLEQLPNGLEGYATRAVAAVFNCADRPPDEMWATIYRWRSHRQVLQGQATTQLNSQARQFFLVTNRSTSSIRAAILDEFARTIVGINTTYHTWSTIDHVERLVKEVQRARDEIDARWCDVANAEEVWHAGLATAAAGRPMVGVKIEQVGQELATWAQGLQWPACTTTLQANQLQQLYPGLTQQAYADLSALLRRTPLPLQEWQREVNEGLPRQFGLEGWSKAEVEQAVARFTQALKHAAQLDQRLRRHTLERLVALFPADDAVATQTPADRLRAWRCRYPIPPEHDLDETAQILLTHLDALDDGETTLLITLPRAITPSAQSYQQWPSYAELEHYVKLVASAAETIANYQPLSAAEQQWLHAFVTDALRRPLANPPREKRRLCHAVATHYQQWLRELRLPAFATTLTSADLHELFAEEAAPSIALMQALLTPDQWLTPDPAAGLLNRLPTLLTVATPSTDWDATVVDHLLAEAGSACTCLAKLHDVASAWLFTQIAPLFGADGHNGSASSLVTKLRAWRQEHVLLANEHLSPNAKFLAQQLVHTADDPANLLLTTLPSRLQPVKTPYSSWPTWQQRHTYIEALATAAKEIAQHGQVQEATTEVQALWDELQHRMAALSRAEQRWLIKAFNEEFRM
ncbi:hypothetical protein [Candidatus Viridilinea mediisalina]|uniref:Uncharacterized protein n=1 Tax=Candidatus Viridilinea mediisalina TaxID=2024553 RepID=A0A2A6RJM8_9CHLR|nr:hypothetical protein [Candidatus Viridilinea mediisalina]PDW03277.1 hypothetical protein CJ255_09530 [Candidatus Viridilinea mediisalina]